MWTTIGFPVLRYHHKNKMCFIELTTNLESVTDYTYYVWRNYEMWNQMDNYTVEEIRDCQGVKGLSQTGSGGPIYTRRGEVGFVSV